MGEDIAKVYRKMLNYPGGRGGYVFDSRASVRYVRDRITRLENGGRLEKKRKVHGRWDAGHIPVVLTNERLVIIPFVYPVKVNPIRILDAIAKSDRKGNELLSFDVNDLISCDFDCDEASTMTGRGGNIDDYLRKTHGIVRPKPNQVFDSLGHGWNLDDAIRVSKGESPNGKRCPSTRSRVTVLQYLERTDLLNMRLQFCPCGQILHMSEQKGFCHVCNRSCNNPVLKTLRWALLPDSRERIKLGHRQSYLREEKRQGGRGRHRISYCSGDMENRDSTGKNLSRHSVQGRIMAERIRQNKKDEEED